MLSKKVNRERIYGTARPLDKQYKPNGIIITVFLSLKQLSLTFNLIDIFPIEIIYYICLIMYTHHTKCRNLNCMKKYTYHVWKYYKFDSDDLKTLYTKIYHCFGNSGKECHKMVHTNKFICSECEKVYCEKCIHICSKKNDTRDIKCLDCCECKNLSHNRPRYLITIIILSIETFIKRIIPKGSIIQFKSIIYDIIKHFYDKQCYFYQSSQRYLCLRKKCQNNLIKKIWKYNINPKMIDTFNHCGEIREGCHKIGRNFDRFWNCNTFVCKNCVKRFCSMDNNGDSYTLIQKSCSGCVFCPAKSDFTSTHTDYSAEERSR